MLNLYLCSLDTVKDSTNVLVDTLCEIQYFEKELYTRLDTSIQHSLKKRGVSIRENVYTGFDCEYNQQTPETNRLVSSQLAVTGQATIQFPVVRNYQMSRLDEKSNKLVDLSKDKRLTKFENSIKMCVDSIRLLKFGNYDKSMKVVIEVFKMIEGLNYYPGEESIVFNFPRAPIQPLINFGDSFTFDAVLANSSTYSKEYFDCVEGVISELLTAIASTSPESFESFEC